MNRSPSFLAPKSPGTPSHVAQAARSGYITVYNFGTMLHHSVPELLRKGYMQCASVAHAIYKIAPSYFDSAREAIYSNLQALRERSSFLWNNAIVSQCSHITYRFLATVHSVGTSIGDLLHDVGSYSGNSIQHISKQIQALIQSIMQPAKEPEALDATIQKMKDAGIKFERMETGIKLATERNVQKWVVYFLPENERWEDKLSFFQEYVQKTGYNLFCHSYKGSSEQELLQESNAVIAELTQRIPPNNMILHGEGELGGFLATALAAEHKMAVVNAFSISSLIDKWRAKIPLVGYLIPQLFNWTLDAKSKIAILERPIVVLTDQSRVDPAAQFRTALEDKRFVDIQVQNGDVNQALQACFQEVHNILG
jgi:hypothetical protein